MKQQSWGKGSPRGVALRAAVSAAVLFVLAAIAVANPSTQAPLCAESAQQAEQARTLVQEGLDKALVEHTTRLFRVWLSIGVQGRENAARGVSNEVRGWLYAQHVVTEWTIPLCR